MTKLLNDNPGYIHDYAYNAPLNEWQRLAKNTSTLSRQLRKANGYRDWQKQSQQFITTLNGLGASVSAHNKAYLKEAIADAYERIGYDFAIYKAIKAKKIATSKAAAKQEELKKYIFIIDEIQRHEFAPAAKHSVLH